VPLTV